MMGLEAGQDSSLVPLHKVLFELNQILTVSARGV